MKHILLLFVFAISNQLYAQKTKIQILNFEDNKAIENVNIYNDSIKKGSEYDVVDFITFFGFKIISLQNINKTHNGI